MQVQEIIASILDFLISTEPLALYKATEVRMAIGLRLHITFPVMDNGIWSKDGYQEKEQTVTIFLRGPDSLKC